MAGLKLYTSNRLEILADELAGILRRPLRSPLQPETIVVPSQGMARWLKLELAQRNGIWANCHFPFPNAFCHELFQAVIPGLETESPFAREVMVWKIISTLPQLAGRTGFEIIKNYLGDGIDARKRFQLASKIAHLFDQYLLYRPELITEWDKGRGEGWQPPLWRTLTADADQKHTPAVFVEFAERLVRAGESSNPSRSLPERVCVFGTSALPAFHLAVLATLATRADVHFFLLAPCHEYWGSVAGPRQSNRLLNAAKVEAGSENDLHLETGNRLLASLGKQGRDFQNLVLDAGDWDEAEHFAEPIEDTLLHAIQADIFHLRDRGRDGSPKLAISPADHSLQIHSCHSPMREMEVLHDQLLDWFQRDPALAPRDVLVMTPDIETYAPFIQAVFDAPESNAHRIPFSLADRGPRRESRIVDTFLALLNLPATRLTATEVLAPLETPAVRARFNLSEADLERIRHWVRETNIRWGLDAEHRAQLGLPAFSENTWRHGLDQLLLGYAMAGRGQKMFGEILPYDDIEGGPAETLGHFTEYFDRLRTALKTLESPRPIHDWERILAGLLDQFFAEDDLTHDEIAVVRGALRELARHSARAGFREAVPLAVVLESLVPALQEDRFGSGFLTGGVTFCALKPMRSIPFKIICLVGMNDTSFPRTDARLSFDEMARNPRLGDRSTREDDRYLFLETLLSARECLHISYVGQSIRDNSVIPPSVVVSELLDYVEQGFESSAKERYRLTDDLVIKHRLQAFSPAYFNGSYARLFSYSAENCAASEISRQTPTIGPVFQIESLGKPDAERRTVDVETLAEFFANPAKFLLVKRLGLRLPFEEDAMEDREAFALDSLGGYQLREELLELKLAGGKLAAHRAAVQSAGRLPPGEPGALTFEGMAAMVEEFHRRIEPLIRDGFREPVPVDLTVGEFRVSGHLNRISATRGLVGFRLANLKGKDRLRHWIRHVVLNAVAPMNCPLASIFAAKDKQVAFSKLADASNILLRLLKLYWCGLSQPLKLFPESSFAYAHAESKAQKGKSRPDPLSAALAKWEASAFTADRAEHNDPHFDLCFRNDPSPLDEDFITAAREVFGPMIENCEEDKA